MAGLSSENERDASQVQVCPVGHVNAGRARFCGECGAPLEVEIAGPPTTPNDDFAAPQRSCANGHPAEQEDIFCSSCGAAVAASTGASPPQRDAENEIPSSSQRTEPPSENDPEAAPAQTGSGGNGHPNQMHPTSQGVADPSAKTERERWYKSRKNLIVVGTVVAVVVAASILVPLVLASSGRGSSSAAVSSEGYSFVNPSNGDQGADPLFVNASPPDYELCAAAYQVQIDIDIEAGGTVSVDYHQVTRDDSNLQTLLQEDPSGTSDLMAVPWGVVFDDLQNGSGATNTVDNYWASIVTQYCTGSPATFG